MVQLNAPTARTDARTSLLVTSAIGLCRTLHNQRVHERVLDGRPRATLTRAERIDLLEKLLRARA